MIKLDGRLFAHLREIHLKEVLSYYNKGEENRPTLTIIQLGNYKASSIYVRRKIEACDRVGIISRYLRIDETTSTSDLKELVQKINLDASCDAVIIQLPLPKQIDKREILETISPRKDVDCLTSHNQGLLFTQKPIFIPCTPLAILHLVDLAYHIQGGKKYEPFPEPQDLAGLNVVVVGRSNLVGRPTAELFLQRNATVTTCHSKSKDLEMHLKYADIAVLAAGAGERISSKIFKKQAIVIDVGIRTENSKICGDLNLESNQLLAYSPVPGGVGPMTVQMLLENVFLAFKNGAKTPINRIS